MEQIIFMLTGEARSGKDTSADILQHACKILGIELTRTYFAKALKESAKEIFGLTDEHVYGSLKETVMKIRISQQDLYRGVLKQLRTGHLKFIPEKMNQVPLHIIASQITVHMLRAILDNAKWFAPCVYECSPRQIMQWWGTEAVRHGAYDGAWIDAVKSDIINDGNKVAIISDARFDNEITEIKKNFLNSEVIVIKLLRGNKVQVSSHVSEAGVSANLVDCTIQNDGSMDDLASKFVKLFSDKLGEIA